MGETMYVTLKMPASAACKLNLTVDNREEAVTVTLTPIELAGRLTVSTGKVVTPEAVAQYCRASQAAEEACRGLIDRYGAVGLVGNLRKGCKERCLWLPEDDEDAIPWLRCVLEAHFHHSETSLGSAAEGSYAWGFWQTAERLVELCEAIFPVAYDWWVHGETGRCHSTEEDRST